MKDRLRSPLRPDRLRPDRLRPDRLRPDRLRSAQVRPAWRATGRSMLRTLIACSAVLAAAMPVAGQRAGLDVVPRAGISMPMGTLPDNTELANGVALGLSLELRLPLHLPVDFRATVDYTGYNDIVERSAAETVQGEAMLLGAAVGVVLRPLEAAGAARPFFLGGLGVTVRDITALAGPDLVAAAGASTRLALHVGGGLDVALGPATLVLELSDYISTFPAGDESRVHHAVFGTAGVRIRLF
jgi:hypothetical protein